jgi:hypothetical protein
MSTFDSLVTVNPRFARSVALSRDAHRSDVLDGYILTPTGRDVLRRLSEALRHQSPIRAWSLTGPYGSDSEKVSGTFSVGKPRHSSSSS